MDYTKKERQTTLSKLPKRILTREALVEKLGEAKVQQATYTLANGNIVIRLVNQNTDNRIEALYGTNTQLVDYLQQYSNVGPFSTEYAGGPRKLDVYLSRTFGQLDLNLDVLPDIEEVPIND